MGVTIAHLSDLHFGAENQEAVWKTVSEYVKSSIKPHCILVTGDVVDSPKKRWYRDAAEGLKSLAAAISNGSDRPTQLVVCRGNHDWHPNGNNVSRTIARLWCDPAQFAEQFSGHVAGQQQRIDVGTKTNRWTIGVLGIESAKSSDYLARGCASHEDIQAFLQAARGIGSADLCIALTHHHLLPVTALEERRKGRFKTLFDATTMRNAGQLLEVLAESHVDIVLHGHEHASHVARYASVEPSRTPVNVVGAGSATGTETLVGCDLARASFNVLVLGENRAVDLQIVHFLEGKWARQPVRRLVEPEEIRRSRFCRVSPLPEPTRSEVTISASFSPDRYVVWRETRTDWRLDEGRLVRNIRNGIGVPDAATVSLRVRHDDVDALPSLFDSTSGVRVVNHPKENDSWQIEWEVPQDTPRKHLWLDLALTWLCAARLTDQDMELSSTRGQQEFVAVKPLHWVRRARVFVTLPQELAPDPSALSVLVEKISDDELKRGGFESLAAQVPDETLAQEAIELKRQLQILAPGKYLLEVPFPRPYCKYLLAWRPPRQPRSRGSDEMVKRAVARGDELAKVFLESLGSAWGFDRFGRVSLFARKRDGARQIERVGDLKGPEAPGASPDALPLAYDTQSGAVWRLDRVLLSERPESEESAREIGFLEGDRGLILLPVQSLQASDCDEPLLVARISFADGMGLRNLWDDEPEVLSAMLAKASMAMVLSLAG